MLSSATELRLRPQRTAWGDAATWDREYDKLRAIPSSYRLSPSRALRRLEHALPVGRRVRVLDAGCGTGRHSLYLAERGFHVHAIDVSAVACAVLTRRLAARPDLQRLVFVEQAVLEPSDLPDGDYDLILDSYVSCHLTSDNARRQYLAELMRLLRPTGTLYTASMGTRDGYYCHHATESVEDLPLVTDPLNGITKLLQTRLGFQDRLSELGAVVGATAERFVDRVANEKHQREVLAAVMRR